MHDTLPGALPDRLLEVMVGHGSLLVPSTTTLPPSTDAEHSIRTANGL
jgi:hypothetical protein